MTMTSTGFVMSPDRCHATISVKMPIFARICLSSGDRFAGGYNRRNGAWRDVRAESCTYAPLCERSCTNRLCLVYIPLQCLKNCRADSENHRRICAKICVIQRLHNNDCEPCDSDNTGVLYDADKIMLRETEIRRFCRDGNGYCRCRDRCIHKKRGKN